MAVLAITEAEVVPDRGSGSNRECGLGGEAINVGEFVYKDRTATPHKWRLADASLAASVAEGDDLAMAISACEADNQDVVVQSRGLPDLGATAGAAMTVGAIYVVSATAGKIAPEVDLIATNQVCVVGIVAEGNKLKLGRTGANLGPNAHA